MNKKTPVLLTIAILLIGILAGVALLYVPESDAPQVSFTLYDSDGVKSVAPGETAEYVIKVENEGSTTGHFELSSEGEAKGWTSSMSHDSINLPAGENQLISLYVTPKDDQADSSIDVNVIATRADNVTTVGTTTFLKGSVQIKNENETEWQTFTPGSEVNEGDDLRTNVNSNAQVDFDDHIGLVLLPKSEIHCRFSNVNGATTTYWFVLNRGTAGFSVNLPNGDAVFTLQLTNGARVLISSEEETVFQADAAGLVQVFLGSVVYREPITRGPSGTRADITIQAGEDSNGDSFDYSIITLPAEGLETIVENANGDKLGFENGGAFVSDNDIKGFLMIGDEVNRFFLMGGEATYFELTIVHDGTEPFDIEAMIFAPDLRSFTFKNIQTQASRMFLRFQENKAYFGANSGATYDMTIMNDEGKTFEASDISFDQNQGNSFKVEDFQKIDDTDSDVVMFGLDENFDRTADQTTAISTGLNGEEILEKLDDDETDEETDYLWLGVLIILIIGAIVVLVFIFTGEKGGTGRKRTTREEEFHLKRAALLEAAEKTPIADEEPGEGMTEDKKELWDDLAPTSDRMEPIPPEILLPQEPAPTPVVGAREYTPDFGAISEPEPMPWAPDETERPSQLPKFKKEIQKPDFQEIDEILKAPSKGDDFTDPGVMRTAVEKHIKDIDDWWDGWNEELDDILKK